MIRALLAPAVALAGRALRQSARRPQFLAPLLIFPMFFLAVNTGGLERATTLPGFPEVRGFLDFQLAAAMTQSLLLGGVMSGIAVALEIEGGFFDRLVTSPIPRTSIILGRLMATFVLSLLQVTWFVVLGLVFGAEIAAGIPGLLVVWLIGGIAGVGFGAIGITLALRAKNASTVQGVFPLVFVVLFLSSAFFPRNLLKAPADAIAAYNPLSYIADGLRSPIIHELSATPILEGVAAATGVALVFGGLAVISLRGRLRDA